MWNGYGNNHSERGQMNKQNSFEDVIIPHKITMSKYLFSFYVLIFCITKEPIEIDSLEMQYKGSGLFSLSTNFLCLLKIGIIKEGSKTTLYLLNI